MSDVGCYEVSGYPARFLVLGQLVSCQMSGVMSSVAILPNIWCYVSGYCAKWFGVVSVAILPDVWCYEVSGYRERFQVLLGQSLPCQMSNVVRLEANLPYV